MTTTFQKEICTSHYNSFRIARQDGGEILARQKRDILAELGFGSTSSTSEVDSIERQIENLRTRLSSQGLDAGPVAPKKSLLDKTLRTLSIPGAAIRGGLRAAVDPTFDLGDISLWENQTSGIELLDSLDLAPKEGDGFGRKAARFGLGLAADIVTDPLSFLAGGITSPLRAVSAPIGGKVIKNFTQQGLAQPLLRGVGAGLKGTGALGAALGNEGVLAARRAATNAAGDSFRPFSQVADTAGGPLGISMDAAKDSVAQAGKQRRDLMRTATDQTAPRPLTTAEKLGLETGEKLKANDFTRGAITAFSKNAFADPTYAMMRNNLARNVGQASRNKLGELDNIAKGLTPDQQRLVADLAEDPAVRAKYVVNDPMTGVPRRLEQPANVAASVDDPARAAQMRARDSRKAPLAQAMPETATLLQDAPLEELPDNVYQAFLYVSESLQGYGNERLRRGMLGSLLRNYFPHKLSPTSAEALGKNFATGAGAGIGQKSGKMRGIKDTLANIEKTEFAPGFEREFVRPFAKEVIESERAIQTFDFFEDITKQFGISADDMAKRSGFAPGMQMPDEVGNYKLVDFDGFFTGGKQRSTMDRQTFGKLGKVYLPTDVADDMSQMYKAYNTEEGISTFAKVWDGATNFWRPLVTTVSIPFHVNNMFGNIWNSFLGGMENPQRLKDGYDIFWKRAGNVKAGVHRLEFDQIREMAEKYGVINSGIFENQVGQDVFRLVREGLPPRSEGNIAKVVELLSPVGKAGAAVKGVGDKLAVFVEGTTRAALFTDNLMKRVGAVQGQITPQMMDDFARQSADHVNNKLFDYAHGLTKFESNVMRRVMPFYSWTKFNIPLQVAELIDKPGKFLLYDKVHDNMASINPPAADTPPWLLEGFATGIDTADGGQVFFNPRLPLQDISRLSPGDSGRNLLGMLNPMIKLPFEMNAGPRGFNLFTQRPTSSYEGETTEVLPGVRVDKKMAHLFDSLSGSLGRIANPVQAIGGDADSVAKLRGARYFFPGLFSYNPERQRTSNAYQESQRLRDLMRKFEDESGEQVPTLRELGF